MTEKIPVSAIVITKNEEHNIADCIAALSYFDEIIIIDAESTDTTRDIAEKLNAKVYVNPWQGYGAQKNFGIAQATHDWVLCIDADERVSSRLAETIARITNNPKHDVYWITIEDIFLGRSLKHLVGHNPRLYNKHKAHWNEGNVHERLVYEDTKKFVQYKDGVAGEIPEPIVHMSYRKVSDYLKKMHVYTTLDARDMNRTNKHRSGMPVTKIWYLPYYLFARQFAKLLVYRKGILDGWQGVVWCALSAYYEFEMASKYLNL